MSIERPGRWGKGLLQKLTMLEDDLAKRPILEV